MEFIVPMKLAILYSHLRSENTGINAPRMKSSRLFCILTVLLHSICTIKQFHWKIKTVIMVQIPNAWCYDIILLKCGFITEHFLWSTDVSSIVRKSTVWHQLAPLLTMIFHQPLWKWRRFRRNTTMKLKELKFAWKVRS